MAKLENIVAKVDFFLTDTRLFECRAVNCRFHGGYSYNCNLKQITLDKNGICLNREEKGKDTN